MTLKQLLEDSSVILKCPSTELRVETRVIQKILKQEAKDGLIVTLQHLVTKIHKDSELEANALPSGALLLKKRSYSALHK